MSDYGSLSVKTPGTAPGKNIAKEAAVLALITAIYFVTSKLGFTMAFVAEQVTVVWPPTGIALAAILLLGYRIWPAIALGAFLTNITANEPLLTALSIATGNTLEAVVGAWLLHHFVGFDIALRRLKDVMGLVFFAALGSTAISATIGVASLCLSGLQPWTAFAGLWAQWWLGDAVGALIAAPFILVWSKTLHTRWLARDIAEGLALIAGLVIASICIFTEPSIIGVTGRAFIYMIFPFVIWASLRFGQRGTSFVTLTASAIAIWATLHNLGPFTSNSVNQSLMLLQSFMAIVAVTGLCLSASKEVDKENAQLMKEIRESDRKKDEFLATLAHELRNPLAPIRNVLEILQTDDVDPQIMMEARKLMERQIQHMIRLVDDLLDIARITRGKIELQMEKIELATIIQNAVEISKPLIDEAKHKLDINLPAHPVYLQGDGTRLAQIFGNLLNNAVKYSNPGSRISISAMEEGKTIVISVRDTGIGIAQDMLLNIFEMFAQGDQAIKQAHGGLGVGLALAKKLVESHHGTITARSEGPGKGSEFIVRLPLPYPNKTAIIHPAIHRTNDKHGKTHRILIVDDNKASAQTIGWNMELKGHKTQLAYDGPTAINIAKSFMPDIILLDIGMPGMNGYEICRALRQEPALKNALFVAQTGWGQEEHRRRSREAGFDYHLIKPINWQELGTLIRQRFESAA